MNRIMLITVAALLCCPLVTRADETTLLEQFLTSPYSEIVIGKKHDGEITGALPRMKPSTVLAVYNTCTSEIRHASPEEITSKQIMQPEAVRLLNDFFFSSSLSIMPNWFQMLSHNTLQELTISQDNTNVTSFSDRSRLKMQLSDNVIGKISQHGIFETTTESYKARHEKAVGKITSQETSHSTGSHVNTGTSKLAANEMTVARQGDQGIESTVHAGASMANSAKFVGVSSFADDKLTLSNLFYNAGSLKSSVDMDISVNVPSDEFDTVSSGFFDNDSPDGSSEFDEQLSLLEQEKLKFDVCTEAEFAKLFYKLQNKRKEQCNNGEPAITIETSAFPIKLFHGHLAEIVVKAKNNGKSAAYNLILLAAIPDNTSYHSFRSGNKADKSFTELYAKSCNSILIRLNRPLYPGGTFKTNALVELAPWIVSDQK